MNLVISGRARNGKDTLAKLLKELLLEEGFIFNTRAYADDLKEMLMRDLDLSYTQVYGNLKEIPDIRYPKESGDYWTPREFLQYFGTDVYRSIDPLFWVKKLQMYISKHPGNYIITDGRFKNEISWVLRQQGICLFVIRDKAPKIRKHISEEEVLPTSFEETIIVKNNFSNIKDFKNYVRDYIIPSIIKKLKSTNLNNKEISNGCKNI